MQTYAQNIETTQSYPKYTFFGVLWIKVIKFIADNSLSCLAWKVTEFALGLFFGALVVKPIQILDGVTSLLKTQDFAPIKIVAVFFLFFYRKSVIRFFRIMGRYALKMKRKADMGKSQAEKAIDGIPVNELADYLFRNGNFKREGINGARQTLGLRMDKYNQLAKKLEENGVLVRGENNLRILSPKWSRQTLVDYLSGNSKSENLKPRIKISRIGDAGKIRLDRGELMPQSQTW